MRHAGRIIAGAIVLAVDAIGTASAEGKVRVTREESRPKTIEAKTGEQVRFIDEANYAG